MSKIIPFEILQQTTAITMRGSATETGSAMITVGRATELIDSVSCRWKMSV
jgi:hypothetical protein